MILFNATLLALTGRVRCLIIGIKLLDAELTSGWPSDVNWLESRLKEDNQKK